MCPVENRFEAKLIRNTSELGVQGLFAEKAPVLRIRRIIRILQFTGSNKNVPNPNGLSSVPRNLQLPRRKRLRLAGHGNRCLAQGSVRHESHQGTIYPRRQCDDHALVTTNHRNGSVYLCLDRLGRIFYHCWSRMIEHWNFKLSTVPEIPWSLGKTWQDLRKLDYSRRKTACL